MCKYDIILWKIFKHLRILVLLGGKRLRGSWNQSPVDPEGQLFNKNDLRNKGAETYMSQQQQYLELVKVPDGFSSGGQAQHCFTEHHC